MAGPMTATADPAIEGVTSAGVQASILEYLHACPVCHHRDLRHYCRVPSLFNAGEFIRYERCSGCGTVLRNPRLPPAYRVRRYEEGALSPRAAALDPKSQTHYAYMMRVLRRLVPGPARLLDFGCGAGGLLVEARAAGFDVMGLELNRALARHVRETHGIPVFQGLIDEPSFAGERFDVIVSSQVFEHLLDPARTLRQVHEHLAGPAVVLIEVPNLRDVRERLRRGAIMDDSHLFYFSAASLGRMLEDGGFRVLAVHEGVRPYRVLPAAGRRFPLWALRGAERLAAGLQLRTGLSVIAQRC
jgi:SAM-dependent methyltransferase